VPKNDKEDKIIESGESGQRLFGTQTETNELNEETPKTPSHSESSSRMSSQLSFYIQSIIQDSVKSEATQKAAAKNPVYKKKAKLPNRNKKLIKAEVNPAESTSLCVSALGVSKPINEKHLVENKKIQVNFSRCNSPMIPFQRANPITRSMETKACQTDAIQFPRSDSSRASTNLDEMSHVSKFVDPMIRRYYFNEIKLLKRRTNHFNSYDESKFVEYSKAMSRIDSIFSVGTNGYVRSRLNSAFNYTDPKVLHDENKSNEQLQKEINSDLKPKTLNSADRISKRTIVSEYLMNRKRQAPAFGTLVKTPRIFLGCGRLTQSQESKLIDRLNNKQSTNKLLKSN